MAWWEKPLIGIDTETTGPNNAEDQIVQWAWALVNPDGKVDTAYSALVMPDKEISEKAAETHGYTEEILEQKGALPRHLGLRRYFELLWKAHELKIPVVAFNAAFDLTISYHESVRLQHAMPKLPVIDPLVIDRKFDKYRKGKRKLPNVCEHYGVPNEADDLHDAEADAILAVRVAQAIGHDLEFVPEKVSELYRGQIEWFAAWAAGLEKWKRKSDPEAVIDKRWPYQIDDSVVPTPLEPLPTDPRHPEHQGYQGPR